MQTWKKGVFHTIVDPVFNLDSGGRVYRVVEGPNTSIEAWRTKSGVRFLPTASVGLKEHYKLP